LRSVPSLVLVISALLLTACATTGSLIPEEERCTRYGGIWRPEGCRQAGGGGGSM